MSNLHDSCVGGHFAFLKTFERIKSNTHTHTRVGDKGVMGAMDMVVSIERDGKWERNSIMEK